MPTLWIIMFAKQETTRENGVCHGRVNPLTERDYAIYLFHRFPLKCWVLVCEEDESLKEVVEWLAPAETSAQLKPTFLQNSAAPSHPARCKASIKKKKTTNLNPNGTPFSQPTISFCRNEGWLRVYTPGIYPLIQTRRSGNSSATLGKTSSSHVCFAIRK
ncbi:hypothetical protein GX48_01108 [Paracoccidioides brasiliensis]|nr:hypothetical protein GX48_01108 [Paracoccidioides brasiliensis]